MDDGKEFCFHLEYDRTKNYSNVILQNDEKNNTCQSIDRHLFGDYIVLFFRLYLLFLFGLLVYNKDESFISTNDIEDENSSYFHIIADGIQIRYHYVNGIHVAPKKWIEENI